MNHKHLKNWGWMSALVLTFSMVHTRVLAQNCINRTETGIVVPVIKAQLTGFDVPEFNPGDFLNGQVIHFHSGTMASPASTTCTSGFNPLWYTGNSAYGIPNTTYNTYPTSVNGLGMRIFIDKDADKTLPRYSTTTLAPGGMITWSTARNFTVELVKTGDITAAGILAGPFLYYRVGPAGQDLIEFSLPTIHIRPRVPTCTVDSSSSQMVELGKIYASELGGNGSVSAKTKNFNLQINCTGGDRGTSTRAFVTLTDANQANNPGNILSLQQNGLQAGEKAADGIGIQILKGSTVLNFGPDSSASNNPGQWFAGQIPQGASGLAIPLQARYIQTKPKITAGVVRARATFTMSYQ